LPTLACGVVMGVAILATNIDDAGVDAEDGTTYLSQGGGRSPAPPVAPVARSAGRNAKFTDATMRKEQRPSLSVGGDTHECPRRCEGVVRSGRSASVGGPKSNRALTTSGET